MTRPRGLMATASRRRRPSPVMQRGRAARDDERRPPRAREPRPDQGRRRRWHFLVSGRARGLPRSRGRARDARTAGHAPGAGYRSQSRQQSPRAWETPAHRPRAGSGARVTPVSGRAPGNPSSFSARVPVLRGPPASHPVTRGGSPTPLLPASRGCGCAVACCPGRREKSTPRGDERRDEARAARASPAFSGGPHARRKATTKSRW